MSQYLGTNGIIVKRVHCNMLNNLQAEIKQVLEKVCSILPDTISQECKDFIANYSKAIIQLLLDRLDPKQVCTALKLCSQEKMFKAAVFPTGKFFPFDFLFELPRLPHFPFDLMSELSCFSTSLLT